MAKGGEREQVWSQPGYQLRLRRRAGAARLEAAETGVRDPERNFQSTACNSKGLACAGDIRLNDWTANGYGLVDRVLWTARNGSTVAGRVWATRAGARKRPAIVITNGSIQASEELYWYAAQTLAKAGYVVITFDPQQQGLLRHLRRGRRPQRGLPLADRGQHVLRLDPGRHRLPAVLAGQAVLRPPEPLGHEPLRQAEPARRRRA